MKSDPGTRRAVLAQLRATIRHSMEILDRSPTEAELTMERAIREARRVLGEKHPDMCTAMGVLGLAHHRVGDLQGARSLLRLVTSSPHGSQWVDAFLALGEVELGVGDLGSARRAFERATQVSGSPTSTGTTGWRSFLGLEGLARLALEREDVPGARRHLAQAATIGAHRLGEDHPIIAQLREQLDRHGGAQGNNVPEDFELTARRRDGGDAASEKGWILWMEASGRWNLSDLRPARRGGASWEGSDLESGSLLPLVEAIQRTRFWIPRRELEMPVRVDPPPGNRSLSFMCSGTIGSCSVEDSPQPDEQMSRFDQVWEICESIRRTLEMRPPRPRRDR